MAKYLDGEGVTDLTLEIFGNLADLKEAEGIGSVVSSSGNIYQMPSSSWRTVTSITLTEGVWLVNGKVALGGLTLSSIAKYQIGVLVTASTFNPNDIIDFDGALIGSAQMLNVMTAVKVPEGVQQTYYLRARQESGSNSYTMYGSISAMRIA